MRLIHHLSGTSPAETWRSSWVRRTETRSGKLMLVYCRESLSLVSLPMIVIKVINIDPGRREERESLDNTTAWSPLTRRLDSHYCPLSRPALSENVGETKLNNLLVRPQPGINKYCVTSSTPRTSLELWWFICPNLFINSHSEMAAVVRPGWNICIRVCIPEKIIIHFEDTYYTRHSATPPSLGLLHYTEIRPLWKVYKENC